MEFSIPLIIISITIDVYSMTDLSLIIRGLSYLGYSGAAAETIGSVMATWASKICLIVNAVASGLSISLIPYMVSSLVKKDYKTINKEFIRSVGIIVVIGLPMAVGISILSNELYTVFYGYSEYGNIVLKLLPFSILYTNINYLISMILQSLNKFKTIYLSTGVGLLTNALLDIPLMILCNKLNIYPYYGAIFATIIGTTISLTISFRALKKEMNLKYGGLLEILKKEILPIVSMTAIVYLIHYLMKDMFNTRITMLIPCIITAIIGALIYFVISYKNGLLYDSLGEDYVNKILVKLKLKK